jgi:hypothetical protein
LRLWQALALRPTPENEETYFFFVSVLTGAFFLSLAASFCDFFFAASFGLLSPIAQNPPFYKYLASLLGTLGLDTKPKALPHFTTSVPLVKPFRFTNPADKGSFWNKA